MELGQRQRRTLEAIVDTFCPSGDGWPSPSELGVADAIAATVAQSPREAERKQFTTLLSLWDSHLFGVLGRAGRRRFTDLEQPEREQLLLNWADSHLPQRRAVFTSLRRAALLFYYVLPLPDGRPNPAWENIGYDGPLGRLAEAPSKPLQLTPIDGDTKLSCDVVVVGSGAGGGPAAAVLAQAGLDVIVVEAGQYYDDEDFDGGEAGAISRFYGGIPAATADQSVGLLAGHALGGGTLVNFSTAFRTPREVRDEWASFGNAAFNERIFDDSLDAVWERQGVSQEYNEPSSRDQQLQRGCAALGWHVDAMPRAVRNCRMGRECGYCGFGCRVGAKQSTVKTWLADAQAAGARLITGVRVTRAQVEAGSAKGVVGRTLTGHSLEISARATILCAGAIQTAALLKRSGLENQNIGRNLWLHPVAAVFGVFEEELKPWEGVMQALYSDQFRDLDGRGYGLKLETGALHPSLLVPTAPWHGARQNAELIRALPYTVPIGILLRDRDGGEVKLGRDGEPIVHYRLSKRDAEHVRIGVDGATQIFEAAGASKIYTGQTRGPIYVPHAGSRKQFMSAVDDAGYGPGQITLLGFHIMGTARMGGSAEISACDPTGQTWEARDLYVFDGSAFPTASGVNPQITIQAISHMGASALAARLSR